MGRWRCWCLFLGVSVAALAGCSKPNPAFNCINSTCIDPNYPYCDADGSIDGTPGVCIAVTCDVGAFGACNGDTALTCNDTGTGYTQTECAHGCDATTGCRLCEANQTVCQNGVVAACDASGVQTSTTNCPLGCFEDQPRCRDIAPSNHLASYFDMVQTPVDLDLSTGSWNLNLDTGVFTGPGSVTVTPASFQVASVAGGPPMRVFVVGELKLHDVYVSAQSSTAAVFLASGDVSITGTARLVTGYVADSTCTAGKGYAGSEQANNAVSATGPGGGGGAASGGKGGVVIDPDTNTAALGGAPIGTDDLQPLLGGCIGGGFINYNIPHDDPFGAAGGGALQISSRKTITISGTIDARGGMGTAYGQGPGDTDTQGGGAGGGILLEAAKVTLAANSVLDAHGGDGFGCTPASATCGAPGKGGTGASAPTDGGTIYFTTQLPATTEFYAGGGGGSVGRVRVNTPNNSYTTDSTSKQNALVTTGALKTR